MEDRIYEILQVTSMPKNVDAIFLIQLGTLVYI